jgi:hypothetical protein
MAWTMEFKLVDTIPGNTEIGTITATWDNPKYVFKQQGTVKDKDTVLDLAEAALKKYVDETNAKADIEILATTELQAAADARPVLEIAVSPNVKPPKSISWEAPWKS